MRGLLLTGGGARGAYQAGVLLGVTRILGDRPAPYPFPVLTGMSAGAINAVGLASGAPDFSVAAGRLAALWRDLTLDQVFRTDLVSLGRIGLGWLASFFFGGITRYRALDALLDPSPLRTLLGRAFDFGAVRRALEAGSLFGVAVLATHYASGASVAFVESTRPGVTWTRARRLGVRTILTVDHVMASTAIPLIFPPVEVDGSWYGDGAIRVTSPFSAAIHLGAERILAVGVRKTRPAGAYLDALGQPAERPTTAGVAAGVLNAVFMDAIDGDLERLNRINTTLALLPEGERGARTALRPITALMISPSEDVGAMAEPHLGRFPARLRYLLRGLGADHPESPDFLSYILFDRVYTRELLDLGERDALARRDEIEALVRDDREMPAGHTGA